MQEQGKQTPSGISSDSSLRSNVTLQALQANTRTELQQMLAELELDMPIELAEQNSYDIYAVYSQKQVCESCARNPEMAVKCQKFRRLSYDKEYKSLSMAVAAHCPFIGDYIKHRKFNQEFDQMMLSPRFRNRTFETFEPSEQSARILKMLKGWVADYKEHSKGLYIFGNYGCGKTHLAVASALALREYFHVSPVFLVVPSFLDKLRDNIQNSESVEKTFAIYRDAPVLVIDDLGEGKKDAEGQLSGWAREKLFTLINHRYEFELTTIITSRYAPQDMERILGQAAVSRLSEMCYFLWNKDEDHRKKNFMIYQ